MRKLDYTLLIIFYIYLFISDWLINNRPFGSRELWAIYDILVHGIVGIFVLLPIIKLKHFNPYFVVFVIFASTIIDVDHAIWAKSVSINKMIALSHRPITHSFMFASLISIAVWGISRNTVVSYTLLWGLVSHILRDGSGGLTPIFWPLNYTKVPLLVYYVGLFTMYLISAKMANVYYDVF